jgi:hypothetical protein
MMGQLVYRGLDSSVESMSEKIELATLVLLVSQIYPSFR